MINWRQRDFFSIRHEGYIGILLVIDYSFTTSYVSLCLLWKCHQYSACEANIYSNKFLERNVLDLIILHSYMCFYAQLYVLLYQSLDRSLIDITVDIYVTLSYLYSVLRVVSQISVTTLSEALYWSSSFVCEYNGLICGNFSYT